MLGTGLNLFCKSGIQLGNIFRVCVVCFEGVFIMCSNPIISNFFQKIFF